MHTQMASLQSRLEGAQSGGRWRTPAACPGRSRGSSSHPESLPWIAQRSLRCGGEHQQTARQLLVAGNGCAKTKLVCKALPETRGGYVPDGTSRMLRPKLGDGASEASGLTGSEDNVISCWRGTRDRELRADPHTVSEAESAVVDNTLRKGENAASADLGSKKLEVERNRRGPREELEHREHARPRAGPNHTAEAWVSVHQRLACTADEREAKEVGEQGDEREGHSRDARLLVDRSRLPLNTQTRESEEREHKGGPLESNLCTDTDNVPPNRGLRVAAVGRKWRAVTVCPEFGHTRNAGHPGICCECADGVRTRIEMCSWADPASWPNVHCAH
eukprot:3438305-Rhodomonas_salina.3